MLLNDLSKTHQLFIELSLLFLPTLLYFYIYSDYEKIGKKQ
jgi:hypothetical protein